MNNESVRPDGENHGR